MQMTCDLAAGNHRLPNLDLTRRGATYECDLLGHVWWQNSTRTFFFPSSFTCYPTDPLAYIIVFNLVHQLGAVIEVLLLFCDISHPGTLFLLFILCSYLLMFVRAAYLHTPDIECRRL